MSSANASSRTTCRSSPFMAVVRRSTAYHLIVAVVIGLVPAAGFTQQPEQEHTVDPDTAHALLMVGPLGIPQTREASGTAWLPDFSPMYAFHWSTDAWNLMLHGNVFLYYLDEGSDRGDEDFGSINWIMAMAQREALGGELTARAMLSAEPATIGECGYPDFLATGEFCDELGFLHDRQHPHDLFMELAAMYERELSERVAIQLYGGLAGEPALGPVGYPHRLSALPNPFAPVTHHWQDATHIVFGVVTAGLFTRNWKLEGSVFNGREPDENRWDLDLDALDSYSGRLWYADERWALQLSGARLTEAELHEIVAYITRRHGRYR